MKNGIPLWEQNENRSWSYWWIGCLRRGSETQNGILLFFFNILNTTAERTVERMRESDGGRNVWEGVMEVVCEEREDGAADWEGDARVLVF